MPSSFGSTQRFRIPRVVPASVLGVTPVLNTPTSAEMHRAFPASGSGSRSVLDLATMCCASTHKRMQADSSAVPSISSNKRKHSGTA
ncbi:hypothetical protein B0H19DRAFT_1245542 [Mycena capillaripes]|nr:hypothetical protein B0H19DRAFT_1245542 [Mycena capillaripes]